jgi:hypothetical protein
MAVRRFMRGVMTSDNHSRPEHPSTSLAGHRASPVLSSDMTSTWPARATLAAAAFLLAAPLHAQSYHGWRLGLGAGPLTPSRQLQPLAASVGGLVSGALTSSAELPVAVRLEAALLWVPRRTNQRLPIAACPTGSTGCIPEVPSPSSARGYLGMSGASGSLLWQWRSVDVGQDYLIFGGGVFRPFSEPRVGDGPETEPSTVGSAHVGYGVRFGAAQRLGLELRYHRLGGGPKRWFIPMSLTFGF